MPSMDLGMSDRVTPIYNRVKDMVRNEIMPLDIEYEEEIAKAPDRWKHTKRMDEILENLKAKAKKEGLWNFFLTHSKKGPGLNTVEYAYLAEETGLVTAGAAGLQLLRARHRQHGGVGDVRLRGSEKGVAGATARRQDPLGLHHDGAQRGVIRRHQHRHRSQAGRR